MLHTDERTGEIMLGRIFYTYDEHEVKNYRNFPILIIALMVFFGIVYFAGTSVLEYERLHPDTNVTNLEDAIWLTYMATSTIGFGDHFPESTGGRVIIGSMFLVGAIMFGVILGLVHNMMMGWLDTNVKNRELRTELKELRKHNESLEKSVYGLREELANLYDHNEAILTHNRKIENKIDDLSMQLKRNGMK